MSSPSSNGQSNLFVDDKLFMGPTIPPRGPELSIRIGQALKDYFVRTPGVTEEQAYFGVNSVFADQTNLTRVVLDVSGYDVVDSVFTAEYVPDNQKPTIPAVAQTQPALLSTLRIRGDKVGIIGIPVFFDCNATNVPIAWLTDVNDNVWLAGQELPDCAAASAYQPVSFEQLNLDPKPFTSDSRPASPPLDVVFHFRTSLVAAREGIRNFAIAQSKGQEVQVKDLDFNLTQTGQEFSLKVVAKLKYKLFSVRFKASTLVTFDKHRLTVTPHKIKVSSSNVFARIALGVASKAIKQFDGQAIPLNAQLPPNSAQFTALEVEIKNQELSVKGHLA